MNEASINRLIMVGCMKSPESKTCTSYLVQLSALVRENNVFISMNKIAQAQNVTTSNKLKYLALAPFIS